MREWKESVEECSSMSRLHVLMAELDNCVKWEKSAENAVCELAISRQYGSILNRLKLLRKVFDVHTFF